MSRRTVGSSRSVKETAWRACSSEQAPDGVIVETCIDGILGKRNVQKLKRRGQLWWTPDGEMYVYYTPTHWRLT
jgi:hypothetical protein